MFSCTSKSLVAATKGRKVSWLPVVLLRRSLCISTICHVTYNECIAMVHQSTKLLGIIIRNHASNEIFEYQTLP